MGFRKVARALAKVGFPQTFKAGSANRAEPDKTSWITKWTLADMRASLLPCTMRADVCAQTKYSRSL